VTEHLDQDAFVALATGAGDARELEDLRSHVDECGECAARAAEWRALRSGARRYVSRRVPPAPDGLADRIIERVHAERDICSNRARSRPADAHAARCRKHWGRALGPRVAALIVFAALVTLALVLDSTRVSDEAVAVTTPFTSACEADRSVAEEAAGRGDARGLEGRRVLVAGVWRGAERARFAEVLARFEQKTGAKVTFAYQTRGIATTIKARLARGCPPDVALLPQPGLLADLARRGELEPIGGVAGREVRAGYGPSWRELASVDGKLYGVWFKAANKSAIWYNRALFERAGVSRPPERWEQLKRVAARVRASGVAPFSVSGADGWTLTDWFENVYLQTAGLERYSKLARHEIAWTDPSVKRALARLAEIFARRDWLAGGVSGARATDYEQSVRQVFAHPPRAAMVQEGSFVANEIESAGAKVGEDAGAFDFPAIGERSPGTVVGGDVAALFAAHARNPAARALIRFLASPEAAEIWARSGGFVSPNRRLDPDVYPDSTTRQLAAKVANDPVRFDLSDLQPPAFGATEGQGMRELLRDYLRSPRRVEAITRALEQAATKAKQCERVLRGPC